MSINLLIDKPKISTLRKIQLFRNTKQALRLPDELIYKLEEILLGDYDTIYSENELRHKALEFALVSTAETVSNDEMDIRDSEYTIENSMPQNILDWESYIWMLSEGNHMFTEGFIYALLKAYYFKFKKGRTPGEVKIIDNMINFMIFNDTYSYIFDEISQRLDIFNKFGYIQKAAKLISHNMTILCSSDEIEEEITPNYEIDITKMREIDATTLYDPNPDYKYYEYTLKRIGDPVPIDIEGLAPEIIMKDGKLTISKQAIDENDVSADEITKINDALRAIEIINEYINIYIDTH